MVLAYSIIKKFNSYKYPVVISAPQGFHLDPKLQSNKKLTMSTKNNQTQKGPSWGTWAIINQSHKKIRL